MEGLFPLSFIAIYNGVVISPKLFPDFVYQLETLWFIVDLIITHLHHLFHAQQNRLILFE